MLKKTLVLGIFIIFVMSISFSQDKDLIKGHSGPLSKLNLTDDQKAKMESFKLEMEKNQIKERSDIQTLQIDVRQIFSKEKFDVAEIKTKYEEISKHELNLKMMHLNFWKSVNDILKPEQQKIWKEIGLKMGQGKNMMNRNGRMGMRGNRSFRHLPPDAPKAK